MEQQKPVHPTQCFIEISSPQSLSSIQKANKQQQKQQQHSIRIDRFGTQKHRFQQSNQTHFKNGNKSILELASVTSLHKQVQTIPVPSTEEVVQEQKTKHDSSSSSSSPPPPPPPLFCIGTTKGMFFF